MRGCLTINKDNPAVHAVQIRHCSVSLYHIINDEADASPAQVLNPIVALTRLAASLHHENGTIAVPGFYECALPWESCHSCEALLYTRANESCVS